MQAGVRVEAFWEAKRLEFDGILAENQNLKAKVLALEETGRQLVGELEGERHRIHIKPMKTRGVMARVDNVDFSSSCEDLMQSYLQKFAAQSKAADVKLNRDFSSGVNFAPDVRPNTDFSSGVNFAPEPQEKLIEKPQIATRNPPKPDVQKIDISSQTDP